VLAALLAPDHLRGGRAGGEPFGRVLHARLPNSNTRGLRECRRRLLQMGAPASGSRRRFVAAYFSRALRAARPWQCAPASRRSAMARVAHALGVLRANSAPASSRCTVVTGGLSWNRIKRFCLPRARATGFDRLP
jgi:hypothetical protein